MGKKSNGVKKEDAADNDNKSSWQEKTKYLSVIANPLAPRKVTKKLYKLVKKARKVKCVTQGIRDVQKQIRKGAHGVLLIAGDVTPLEVVCHMPLVCEESNIPYCYTPAKQDLGAALGMKRASVMLLVKSHEDYKDSYDECYELVKNLPQPL